MALIPSFPKYAKWIRAIGLVIAAILAMLAGDAVDVNAVVGDAVEVVTSDAAPKPAPGSPEFIGPVQP